MCIVANPNERDIGIVLWFPALLVGLILAAVVGEPRMCIIPNPNERDINREFWFPIFGKLILLAVVAGMAIGSLLTLMLMFLL